MAFKDFPDQQQGVQLLQRSLTRGRLGHAYLFTGHELEPLEGLAATLAKTLNCQNPVRKEGAAVDCCDQCIACRKIEHGNHPDVHWVRPESKMRVIRIRQITRRADSPPRVMLEFVGMKPTEGRFKVGIVVAADRMNEEAASAFLKTLEEPPSDSVLILLSTDPQPRGRPRSEDLLPRTGLLETILSRCLRLNFGGESMRQLPPTEAKWISEFSDMAAMEQKSLLGRYRLLDVLLKRLADIKASIEETLSARSPLEHFKDVEQDLIERWETELAAAIEAEYRRQRSDLLAMLQAWLRDVWIQTTVQSPKSKVQSPKSKVQSSKSQAQSPNSESPEQLLNFPQLEGTKRVASRISPAEARENLEVLEQLQRWLLYTNVQETPALEVGLLKLRL